MKAIFINHNFTPDWIHEYNFDYLIYDRSDSKKYLRDFPQDRITYTDNIGNVDRDRLAYIVENYDDLPDVFLLSKTNLFKYITKEEFDKVKDNKTFTPLLTQNHKVYEPICRYVDGMYEEINNSWYVPAFFTQYLTYNDWAKELGLPTPEYLQFPPGGNFIVTREVIHRHPKLFYKKLKSMLEYTELPAEAQFVERTYYTLWK
jgi:hypothetical protein